MLPSWCKPPNTHPVLPPKVLWPTLTDPAHITVTEDSAPPPSSSSSAGAPNPAAGMLPGLQSPAAGTALQAPHVPTR